MLWGWKGAEFCSASLLMAFAVSVLTCGSYRSPWPATALSPGLLRSWWLGSSRHLSFLGCQNPFDQSSPVPWWSAEAPLWSWKAQFSVPRSPWHAGPWSLAQSLVLAPCLSFGWSLSCDAPLSSTGLSLPLKLFLLVQHASVVHYSHSSDHALELIYMSADFKHTDCSP